MKGVFPILSTPFDSEDNIVFEDVQSEVDYAVKAGVNGIAIALAKNANIYLLDEPASGLDPVSYTHLTLPTKA